MLSSMFVHGGFLHVGSNMLYLWVFGKTMEDRFGYLVFAVLYVTGGIVGALSQSWIDDSSTIPLVGASGAIAGVLGAYLVLYPLSRVRVLLITLVIGVVRVPAILLLGLWGLLQFFNGLGSIGPEVASTGVAYFAHLGGFALGVAVAGSYQAARLGRVLGGAAVAAISSRGPGIAGILGIGRRKPRSTRWVSVSRPNCGSDELDFLDPPIRLWRCRRCHTGFS